MSTRQDLPKLEAAVRLYRDSSRAQTLLGFADLTIAGAFVIRGIRILMSKPKEDKQSHPFLSFPSRKGSGEAQDKYFEIAHPITAQARQAVQDMILSVYEKESHKAA